MLPSPARSIFALLVLLSVPLWAACSDGGNGGTGPDPAISISVSPGSLTIEQGDDGTITVTLTRSGGFEGAVVVTVTGLPTGVVVPAGTIPGGSTQVQLTVSAESGATVGAATLTVRATGSGVDPATATLSLQVEEAPVGTFTLSLDPSTLTLTQGESGSSTVGIDRSGGFQGTVSLTVSGVPSGLAAALASSQVTGSQTTLQLTADAGLTPDTYLLTVTGSGQGTTDATAQLQVTVEEASAGTFELSLSPATLNLEQGESGVSTVGIDRSGGFQGTVDLSLSGVPAGLSATLASTAVTGNETTLDVAADAGLAPGSYTVTVNASGTDTEDRTVQLDVTVTQSQGGGTTQASWTYCTDVPVWFAVQDGMGGTWTRVTPTGGSTFEFEVASDVVGVATVEEESFQGSTSTELTVYLMASSELSRVGGSFCETEGPKTVTVTAQPLAADEVASLSLGTSFVDIIGAGGNSGTFEDVPQGTVDLFGVRSTVNQTTFARTVNRFYLQRGLDPADNSAIAVDFSGANGFDPVTATATIQNLGSDMAGLNLGFVTRGVSAFTGLTPLGDPLSAATQRTLFLVPGARQESDDVHAIFLNAVPSTQDPDRFRSLFRFFAGAGDQQLPLGPDLDPPAVSVSDATGFVRLRFQLALPAAYERVVSFNQSQTDRDITLIATEEYRGGGAVDLVFPDLSEAAGWDDTWGIQTGEMVDGSVSAWGWTGPGSIFPSMLTDGLEIAIGTRSFEITP